MVTNDVNKAELYLRSINYKEFSLIELNIMISLLNIQKYI